MTVRLTLLALVLTGCPSSSWDRASCEALEVSLETLLAAAESTDLDAAHTAYLDVFRHSSATDTGWENRLFRRNEYHVEIPRTLAPVDGIWRAAKRALAEHAMAPAATEADSLFSYELSRFGEDDVGLLRTRLESEYDCSDF